MEQMESKTRRRAALEQNGAAADGYVVNVWQTRRELRGESQSLEASDGRRLLESLCKLAECPKS